MTKQAATRRRKRGFFQIVFGRTMVIILLLVLQFAYLFARMLTLADRIPFLAEAESVLVIAMLIYVLNTKDDPTVKLSWCFLIAVLPVFGTLLYFFIQCDLGHRVQKRIYERSLKESASCISEQGELLQQIGQEEPEFYGIAEYLKKYAGSTIYRNSTVRYFPLGEAKFEEMLHQLEQAEHFIFLEYFIVDKGYMWDRILEILERKAKQGVDVRVMYDGTCAVMLLPYSYPKQLHKKGIQCKMFSPLCPFVSTHYNNRDHRKILVIDGHTAFTGGVNLADEYINRIDRYGHWKDTAVMVKGEAARGFTLMFLQMWNCTETNREYAEFLGAPVPEQTAPGYVIPYGDVPNDQEKSGEMVYLDILNCAKDYVYMMTPYLIMDSQMITAMQFAAKRGVDVRLIVPGRSDHKYTEALAKGHYQELVEAGVKVYEYTPGFVHAKVFVSDDTKAVVGTINLDYRSLYLHYECAAFLYKVPAISDILKDFGSTLAVSRRITHEDIKKQSLITRIVGRLLKVAAPLM